MNFARFLNVLKPQNAEEKTKQVVDFLPAVVGSHALNYNNENSHKLADQVLLDTKIIRRLSNLITMIYPEAISSTNRILKAQKLDYVTKFRAKKEQGYTPTTRTSSLSSATASSSSYQQFISRYKLDTKTSTHTRNPSSTESFLKKTPETTFVSNLPSSRSKSAPRGTLASITSSITPRTPTSTSTSFSSTSSNNVTSSTKPAPSINTMNNLSAAKAPSLFTGTLSSGSRPATPTTNSLNTSSSSLISNATPSIISQTRITPTSNATFVAPRSSTPTTRSYHSKIESLEEQEYTETNVTPDIKVKTPVRRSIMTPLASSPTSGSTLLSPKRIQKTPKGLVGLSNLGNTCFMNATIQCLSNVPMLRDVFLGENYKKDLNTSNSMKGMLATEFGELITQLWSLDENQIYSPDSFKQAVAKWAPQFRGYRQQDSQEFLRFLLDGLHEDLNRVRAKLPYVELKDIDGEPDFDKSTRWWSNYTERNDSFMTDLFCGQLKSSVKCLSCNNVSTTFDPFMDVSLPIPTPAEKRTFLLLSGSSSSHKLSDCLASFTEEEMLGGQEKVYCGKCKTHRNSVKKLTFFRLPKVLVLHLKRFSMTGQKITSEVKFPLQGLDMQPYVDPEACKYIKSLQNATYDLHGVVQHFGSLGGGHYTAFCKSEDDWYSFNDSQVKKSSDSHVKASTQAAYVLFYVRK